MCVFSQEGVDRGIYSPMEVNVETDDGDVCCRTYQMTGFHVCPPAPQYKQVTLSPTPVTNGSFLDLSVGGGAENFKNSFFVMFY